MARFCFYCNRELAAGESCQCRLKARENLRRKAADEKEYTFSDSTAHAAYSEYRQTSGTTETAGNRARSAGSRARSAINWSGLRPTLADFARPLDQLDRERPNLTAAIVWIAAALLLQGVFLAVLAGWRLFFVGVLYGFVSLALLTLLLFIQIRLRMRRPFRLEAIFAHARPVFLYASTFYLLAVLAAAGNPLFGFFLFLLGDFAAKSGLLWQIRHNSPLERNRYFLQVLLTIVVHTLFQSIFIQSILGSLTAGF